jgi:hypothetical protein
MKPAADRPLERCDAPDMLGKIAAKVELFHIASGAAFADCRLTVAGKPGRSAAVIALWTRKSRGTSPPQSGVLGDRS